jgi:hypothetical protein
MRDLAIQKLKIACAHAGVSEAAAGQAQILVALVVSLGIQ